MFWKRIKKNNENKYTSSFSITRRLVILSTVSSFIILFLSVAFLYWALKDNLENKDAKFLVEEIFEFKSLLQDNSYDWKLIKGSIEQEGIIPERIGKYYRRILDEKGNILVETSQMNKIIPAKVFPAPITIDPDESGEKWKSRDGKTFLMMSTSLEVGRLKKHKYIFQFALDISQDENLINSFRNKIALVFFLGILFSGVINVAVAKTGMRPLKEITTKIHQVTASQLHERIHPEQWPKELNALTIAFDKMLDRLEDSFDRLSQFSINLAHELRTPINNLMGEAQVALSKVRTQKEYIQILESSLEEFSRLSRMIDNLLFLARSENKEIKPELISFDARREIEAVIEFYEAVAQEQEIQVICEGAASLTADTILFRRLINNLLSNALQYTPKGGKITISIRQTNKNVDIVVNDTGIGINPADLPNVFSRFFRSESARLKYPQGMGLGLNIVKSIMNLHGGNVAIQSMPAKGTTVTLIFPQ